MTATTEVLQLKIIAIITQTPRRCTILMVSGVVAAKRTLYLLAIHIPIHPLDEAGLQVAAAATPPLPGVVAAIMVKAGSQEQGVGNITTTKIISIRE